MLRGPRAILEFTRELITLTDRRGRSSVRLDCRYGARGSETPVSRNSHVVNCKFTCYAGDSSAGNDSWLT